MRSDSDNYVGKYFYHFIEHIWRKDAKRMEFQFQIGRSGNTYEIIEQRKKLKKEEPTLCGVCLKENDDNDNEFVGWIHCSICTMWILSTCTHLSPSVIPKLCCHYYIITSSFFYCC